MNDALSHLPALSMAAAPMSLMPRPFAQSRLTRASEFREKPASPLRACCCSGHRPCALWTFRVVGPQSGTQLCNGPDAVGSGETSPTALISHLLCPGGL